uniref:Optic atrophy 3 protein homolog n=2 Tax=Hirondellea gigas TaxID=1518452 RepID=A0A6A7FXV3_9CRUS
MVAAFPVVKLGVLLVKQISKPLANFVKKRAMQNAFFAHYVCMPPAQFYHWCDVRMKMYLTNIIRNKDSMPIPKLNEQAAIELGANLLGEFVIIFVASSILLWEYNRQTNNEAQKEAAEQQFVNDLEHKITELGFSNEELDTKLRELTRLVYATPAIMVTQSKLAAVNSNDNVNVAAQPVYVPVDGAISKAVQHAKIKLRPS